MKTYTIVNTNNNQITITPSVGTAVVLEKDTVTIGTEGPHFRIRGFEGIKERNLTFKYTQVTTPASPASAAALKTTVLGYIRDKKITTLGAAASNTEDTLTDCKKRVITVDGTAITFITLD